MYIEKDGERRLSDQEFMAQVYQQFDRLMFYTARKYTSDLRQCEDVVQDSLEKLIEKVETLRTFNEKILASYIVVTVRNTAINYLRRQGVERTRVVGIEDLCEEPQDQRQPLDEYLIRQEEGQRLKEVWPFLDEETRQLLEGKYILEYDNRQLAELMGCQTNSVRMKLFRARRKAQKMMKGGKTCEKSPAIDR